MIINSVRLNNFGIYYGESQYDFSVNKDRNIVLISGKNGSGKTTLLNSIKLGIYGPQFLGYQTYNEKYYEYIESKLNAFAIEDGKENYSISIDLSFLEKGQYSTYNINRNWTYNNGKLKEDLQIVKDNTALQQREAYDFLNSLYSFMPPVLFDLFFFDGEKIEKLFMLKNGTTDIIEFIDVLFNLDLFNNLSNDLKNYIKQKNVYSTLDSHEKEEIDLKTIKEEVEEEIARTSEQILQLKEEIRTSKDDLNKVEQDFKILGGLDKEELNIAKKEISELEAKKEEMLLFNRNIVLEYLPFIILRNKMNELAVEINAEKDIKNNMLIRDKLIDPELKRYILNSLSTNSDLDQILSSISDYFNKDSDKKLIYNLSKEEEQIIEGLITEINNVDLEQFLKNFEIIKAYNEKVLEIRRNLEYSLNDEFTEKMEKIKELQSAIAIKDEQININNEQLKELDDKLHEIGNRLINIKSEIKNVKKDENVFTVVSKINNVIKKYTETIKADKLKNMEHHVTDIFNTLIRKDDFIKRIDIDSTTSQIKLINKLDKVMPEDNLSAGEKQIYVLSLLWAMIRVSDRKIPLVFDTLLGRLDKSHKSNIISNFLHTCGDQVIIMATDSEIDDEYHQLLKPFIGKYYKIDYDNMENKVTINSN